MRKWFGGLTGLSIVALLLALVLQPASADRGVPGSQEFGFGSVLYLDDATLSQGLALASELRGDWIYIPVSMDQVFPAPGKANLAALDQAMKVAAKRKMAVALSLTAAPDWAMTEQGPNPLQTAALVRFLVERYPVALKAVELFPRANTRIGWGAPANPTAYMQMFLAVKNDLQSTSSPVLLVGAGLQPVAGQAAAGDIDDLQFLQSLYEAGAQTQMPVVSIQYPQLSGEPLSPPVLAENRVLRHYEQVRQVMTDNGHQSGLIWITRLNLPTGAINPDDAKYQDEYEQSTWLQEAYGQIRSQLYIGAAFLQSFNPGVEPGCVSLLRSDGTYHLYYEYLKTLLGQNMADDRESPGRPKSGILEKDRK